MVNQGNTEQHEGLTFELINAFMMENDGWVARRAAKSHLDAFGDAIAHRETYYFRQLGTGIEEVSRLSSRSMQGILNAIFHCNPHGIRTATNIIAERWHKIVEAINGAPKSPTV